MPLPACAGTIPRYACCRCLALPHSLSSINESLAEVDTKHLQKVEVDDWTHCTEREIRETRETSRIDKHQQTSTDSVTAVCLMACCGQLKG